MGQKSKAFSAFLPRDRDHVADTDILWPASARPPCTEQKGSRMRTRKPTLASRGAVIALAPIAALLLGSMPSLAAGDAAAGKQTFTTTCGALVIRRSRCE